MQTRQAPTGRVADSSVVASSLASVEKSTAWPAELEGDVGKVEDVGSVCLSASSSSERMAQEHLQDLTVGDGDSHLVEFSDALQAVAKSLRQVAVSKARAQDEAAEWKRKYEHELERSKQLQWGRGTDFTPAKVYADERPNEATKSPSKQEDSDSQRIDSPSHWNGRCCSRRGICTQQIIREQSNISLPREEETSRDSQVGVQKSPFRLAWGSDNKKTRRHEHDTVSYDCGNITTAVQGCKQITLQWDCPPQSVFILTKPDSAPVAALFAEMVRWLRDIKGVHVYVEPSVKEQLRDNSLGSSVVTCANCFSVPSVIFRHCWSWDFTYTT